MFRSFPSSVFPLHAAWAVLTLAAWLFCGVVMTTPVMAQGGLQADAMQDPLQPQLIEDVQFRGNRRIPTDTLRLYVTMKPGDLYSAEQAQRDYQAVLAQGFLTPCAAMSPSNRAIQAASSSSST